MSGASGKTPAAIHVTPEALEGGPLAYVRDGDIVRLDAEAGVADHRRRPDDARPRADRTRCRAGAMAASCSGRSGHVVSSAERGASVCFVAEPSQQQPEIRDVADPNVQNRAVDA